MQLLRFTDDSDGSPLYISVARIIAVYGGDHKNPTTIELESTSYTVREPIREVVRLINEALILYS